jgi:hypothetical protein
MLCCMLYINVKVTGGLKNSRPGDYEFKYK